VRVSVLVGAGTVVAVVVDEARSSSITVVVESVVEESVVSGAAVVSRRMGTAESTSTATTSLLPEPQAVRPTARISQPTRTLGRLERRLEQSAKL
jgi:hypothetical protein